MKKSVTILLALALLAGLAACGGTPSAPAGEPVDESQFDNSMLEEAPAEGATDIIDETAGRTRISVIAGGSHTPYWDAVRAGAEKAAADYAVELGFTSRDDDPEADSISAVVAHELAKVPAAVAVYPGEDLSGVLADCAVQGVPVIGLDGGAPGSDGAPSVAAYTDEAAAGALAAEHMAEDGDLRALLTTGSEESPCVVGVLSVGEGKRDSGFTERMRQLLSDLGYTAAVGEENVPGATVRLTVGEDAMAMLATPQLIGVFCAGQEAAEALLAATVGGEELDQGAAFGALAVVGFDSGAAQLSAVRSGRFLGAVTRDPFRMGYHAVELCVRTLQSGAAESAAIPAAWYDAASIDDESVAAMLYQE